MFFLLCHLRLGIFSYHYIAVIYTNCFRTVTEAAPENMHFFITKNETFFKICICWLNSFLAKLHHKLIRASPLMGMCPLKKPAGL